MAFDDLSLVEEETSTNLLTNPGFETGASGWTEYADGEFPATSLVRSVSGIAAPHGGAHAYAIGNLTSDQIAVDGSGTYELHAYVRGELDAEGSFKRWLIRAYYYDASAAYLGYEDVDWAYADYAVADWQLEGGQLTLPQHTAQVAIRLYNYEATGWVAFDDVSLVRTDESGPAAKTMAGQESAPTSELAVTGSRALRQPPFE